MVCVPLRHLPRPAIAAHRYDILHLRRCGRYVVIGAGDCLWNHFGANSAKVAAANGISNPNQVRAGTRIYY